MEGKNNDAGIKFRDNTLVWNGLSIKVLINSKDEYAQLSLMRKIKYCRILKNGIKYYLQLVLEAGITSHEKVSLLELAPEINAPYRKIRELQRKMDRSRRANNPHKFNENGTFNRSNKERWVKSKHYQRDQYKLQRIQDKFKTIRKQSHNRLANEIISHGTEVYVETMSYKGLQKRAKKTTKNKKGKINSKKRFGKSLANKAPALLLTILDNKLRHHGTELHRIRTAEVKVSQYNHVEDNYKKKELSERWTMIGEDKLQRDLYSSVLVMNVNPDLGSINREYCLEKYEKFKTLHGDKTPCL